MTITQNAAELQAANEVRADQQLSDAEWAVHSHFPAYARYRPVDRYDNEGDTVPAAKLDSKRVEAEAQLFEDIGPDGFIYLTDRRLDHDEPLRLVPTVYGSDGASLLYDFSRLNLSSMTAVALITKYWSKNAVDRDVWVAMERAIDNDEDTRAERAGRLLGLSTIEQEDEERTYVPAVWELIKDCDYDTDKDRVCLEAICAKHNAFVVFDPTTNETHLQSGENDMGELIRVCFDHDKRAPLTMSPEAIFEQWKRQGRRMAVNGAADIWAVAESDKPLVDFQDGDFCLLPRWSHPAAIIVQGATQSYKTSSLMVSAVHTLKADQNAHASYFMPMGESPQAAAKVALAAAQRLDMDPADLKRRLHFHPTLTALSDPAQMNWLVSKVRADGSKFCYVDPWAYAREGIREQDSADQDLFNRLARVLASYGCSLIVVDHTSTADPAHGRGNRGKEMTCTGRLVLSVDKHAPVVIVAYAKAKGSALEGTKKFFKIDKGDGSVMLTPITAAEYRALRTPKAKGVGQDDTAVDVGDQTFIAGGVEVSPAEPTREPSQSERKRERDRLQKQRWRAKQSDNSDMSDPLSDPLSDV